MTRPDIDKTADEILDSLIKTSEADHAPAHQTGSREAPTEPQPAGTSFQQLEEFLQSVSPYARLIIPSELPAAVSSEKLDAVPLANMHVTLKVQNLNGKPKNLQRQDELIRCDEKALAWRAETEQRAARNWMLHTGKISGDQQKLLSDEHHFDEVLALRREFSRQSAKKKIQPATPKKVSPKTRDRKTPSQ